jgi:galacturan 1,4-alpha-galacturonidase
MQEDNPSTAQITEFYVKNVSGTTSDTTVVDLDCPADGTCYVYLENFSVKPSSGTAQYLCSDLNDESSLGITCTGAATQ